MSAPELHADDLLDKEVRGQLTPEERSRLESHLSACAVCRFERKARGDFRAEFEADAQRERDAPVRLGEVRGGAAGRAFALSTRPRRSRLGTTLLLVATLLVAGVAAAELARIRLRQTPATPAPSATRSVGGISTAAHRHPNASAEVALASSAPAPSAAPPAPEPEPAAAASRALPVVSDKPATPAAALPNVAASSTASFPALGEPVAALDAAPTASLLFAHANRQRERGAYDDAVRSYTSLIDAYPREPEALSARVMLGRLLLDRGEPRIALGHFEAYLAAGGGSLAEEAELGRALALRKLGRATDEIQAWDALLAAHPNSVHAARARERLSELGAQ